MEIVAVASFISKTLVPIYIVIVRANTGRL